MSAGNAGALLQQAAAHGEGQGQQELDPAEVCLLVLHWLSGGPCQGAARVLEAEALQHGLLPRLPDVPAAHLDAAAAPSSYAQLMQQHQGLPSSALQELLAQVLAAKRASGVAGAQGLTTLLGQGPLAALPQLAATSAAPPRWLRPPQHPGAGPMRSQLLREVGVHPRVGAPTALLAAPTALVAGRMQLLRTVRGHKMVVYCIAYDPSGRYIATGSDDYLVKIWSATTAMLLHSCRGHEAEIADIKVSRDGHLLASGACDHTIRVWSLEHDTLGWPVSILTGHTSAITYLDFSPVITHALVSASSDGSCRLWDARAGGSAAAVLRSGAAFDAGLRPSSARSGRAGSNGVAGAAAGAEGNVTGMVRLAAQQPGRAAGGAAGAAAGTSAPTARQQALAEAHAAPAVVGAAERDEEGAGEEAQAKVPGLLCVKFSPCGTFIAAGSEDCSAYLWLWPWQASVTPDQQTLELPGAAHAVTANLQRGGATSSSPAADGGADAAAPLLSAALAAAVGRVAAEAAAGRQAMDVDAEAGKWPAARPVSRLLGHKNDVYRLQFSHGGRSLATASHDGTVRVWRHVQYRSHGTGAWEEAHVLVCSAAAAEAQPGRAGGRRRANPVPSVNQVCWTIDDARVLAAVSDHSVRVWDAASGEQLHLLQKHTAPAHVLECHPRDARLAMSAAYDGLVCLWDIQQGVLLKSFCSTESFPLAGGRWADPIARADGAFSPDGSSIAIADVAGQFSVYGCSGDAAPMAAAPYDQFLSRDYGALLRDTSGNVLDADTQTAPHLVNLGQQLLVDFLGDPYPEAVQQGRRSGRQPASVPPAAASNELPMALQTDPPTLLAAAWRAMTQHEGSSVSSAVLQRHIAAAIADATERYREVLDALAHGRHVIDIAAELDAAAGSADGGGGQQGRDAATAAARSRQRHQDEEDEGEDMGYLADLGPDYEVESSPDDSSDFAYESDASEGPALRRRQQQQQQQQQGEQRHQRQTSRYGRRLRRTQQTQGTAQEQGPLRRSRRGAPEQGSGLGAQGSERALRHTRRRQRTTRAGSVEEGHGGSEGGSGASSGSSDADELLSGLSDEEERGFSSDDTGASGSSGHENSDEEGRPHKRRRFTAGQAHDRRSGRAGTHGHRRHNNRHHAEEEAAATTQSHRQQAQRTHECYAWLQACWRSPFAYVPQLGDAVVYIRPGHEQYLRETADKRTARPWQELVDMRPSEPCEVVELQYVIADDGSRATTPRLTLRLCDASSPLLGRQFCVELPPPLEGHGEFVVLRAHYDAGVRRIWGCGNRAQVYFQREGAPAAANPLDTGAWSRCTIVADGRSGQPEAQVLSDPYGCGGLWERYQVVWDAEGGDSAAAAAAAGGDPGGAGASAAVIAAAAADTDASAADVGADADADAAGASGSARPGVASTIAAAAAAGTAGGGDAAAGVCPWELFPLGESAEEVLRTEPQGLSAQQVQQFLEVLGRAAAVGRFSEFVSVPAATARWRNGDGVRIHYNAQVALPLALETLQCRLAQRYYRTIFALEHDLATIALNAATFHGADSELAADAALLQRYVSALLKGEEPPDVAWEEEQEQQKQEGEGDAADTAAQNGGPSPHFLEAVPRKHRSRAASGRRRRRHSDSGADSPDGISRSARRSARGASRGSNHDEPDHNAGAPSAHGRRRSSRLGRAGAASAQPHQEQQPRRRPRRHAARRMHDDEVSGGELSSDADDGWGQLRAQNGGAACRPTRHAARRTYDDQASSGEVSSERDGGWSQLDEQAGGVPSPSSGHRQQGHKPSRRASLRQASHAAGPTSPTPQPEGRTRRSSRHSNGAAQHAPVPGPDTEQQQQQQQLGGRGAGRPGLRVRLPPAAAAAAPNGNGAGLVTGASGGGQHAPTAPPHSTAAAAAGDPAAEQAARPPRIRVKLRRASAS